MGETALSVDIIDIFTWPQLNNQLHFECQVYLFMHSSGLYSLLTHVLKQLHVIHNLL